MNKRRKYVIKAVKIFIAVVLLLITGVIIFVSVNKDKIIAQVTSELEEKLNGKLTLGKVELSFIRNFPAVSVLLSNVSLTDTMHSVHKHTFFTAKEVFVSLAVTKLIKKESPLKGLRIDDGSIYLFTDTAGYTNSYLLSSKKTKKTNQNASSGSELKSIELNNVNVTVNDLKRGKLHDFSVKGLKLKVDDQADKASINTRADIIIKSLAFNTDRGSFLKDKALTGNFDLAFDKGTNKLSFDSIRVKISGQLFNMTGSFDLKSVSPQFNLRLHSNDIHYTFISSLLPVKIAASLGIVSLDKPLSVHANINGPLKGGDPVVIANWSAKNTTLKTPFLDFDKATFKGFFSNEVVQGLPRKDPNSKIEITDFTAEWHGLPVTSHKIAINNLSVPELSCDIASAFDLAQLNELIPTNSLKLTGGKGNLKLNYKGPIVRNNNTNSFLNGEILFTEGNLIYVSRNVEMSRLNGKLLFINSNVFIENLRSLVLGQQITMQGEAKNLLTLINTEPDKAIINYSIYSPSLNLGSFMYLLKPRNTAKVKKENKNQLANAAEKIDRLLEDGKLNVQLKADRLIYKNFTALNANAEVTLLNDRYILNNVSMNHAGGTMGITGTLLNTSGKYHQAQVNVNMTNVNVSKVLQSFENFGQDAITWQNLEGNLTAKITAAMMIDPEGKVLPSSILSKVDFSLKNGALLNYEPVKKLQRFVFKNRDFENIRFAELKNTLEVKNQDIRINRMEIQSTVISMFVEGNYSQTGGTDMSIQIPLNNLKKRDDSFNPENIGADKKGGSSIFIRGRPGPDGNVKFKLDLFNRFNKEKENKKNI